VAGRARRSVVRWAGGGGRAGTCHLLLRECARRGLGLGLGAGADDGDASYIKDWAPVWVCRKVSLFFCLGRTEGGFFFLKSGEFFLERDMLE
jgi:hypothetical protein